MYQELSGENIKGYENELDEKVRRDTCTKTWLVKDYRLGRELDHKGNYNLISLEEQSTPFLQK